MSHLSECIRKGIEKVPEQNFNAFFEISDDGSATRACVLGTALAGSYSSLKILISRYFSVSLITQLMIKRTFPEISKERTQCPICGSKQVLWSTLIHLNDHHRWSREAIADWLEALEVAKQPVEEGELVEVG